MCVSGLCGLRLVLAILNIVVAVALLAGVIYLFVRGARPSGTNHGEGGSATPGGQSAREIAEERYARGEISRDEFQQILNDLGPSGR